jgi:alpha-glucosidase
MLKAFPHPKLTIMEPYLKFFRLLGCALLFSVTSLAQTKLIKTPGNVTSVNIQGNKISFTTTQAYGEATVYAPGVIRVRVNKSPLGRDFSYAVIAKPQQTKATINQNDTEITILTDSLQARITKKPFSVSFYTLDGKLINQDETGLTTSWIGDEVTTYKKMQEGERFIGLGEKTGNLDRKGSAYTNWNTDAFGYSVGQDPIYSTIPFYVGIHSGLNYGIFFDNTFQSDFNFGASNNRFSSFSAQGGEMNYYFIYNKQLSDIISSYSALTGKMNMPPLWSLGYQQNRYSYYPETEVMRIAQTLREKKIPADGITLDIHYMDNYKLFTWNKDRFPNPAKMNAKLSSMGFKTTVIVDPGIKVEQGYGAYQRGLKDDIFIKYSDGTNYTGQVWPGWCHFPDFTSEKGRAWWGNEVKFFANSGVSGLWNDMNEIATWGQKMPNNVLFNYDGDTATHKQAHNIYGLQMAKASYESARKEMNKRPFVLTRAGYSGLQRYSALWTGDNRAEDDHMLLGIRLMNSLGISGVPFTGMDVGGFTGGASPALFVRWMQIGAFTPYFRNHTGVNTKSSEPWTYGEEVLEISRNYVNLRYTLLPYIYCNFYKASQNGQPLMRTLAIDNTHDAKVYDPQFQNQYFFGNAFMIAPSDSKTNFLKVYFPKGKFYDFYSDDIENGNQEKNIQLSMQKLPIYVKESSIIPMQSLIQSTSEKPTDTLTIHLYQGDRSNEFVYYEDDGESFNNEKGVYYKRTISYNPASRSLTFSKPEGSFNSKFKNLRIILHGFGDLSSIKSDGKTLSLKNDSISFLAPISKFDPVSEASKAEMILVKSIVVKNDAKQISFTY